MTASETDALMAKTRSADYARQQVSIDRINSRLDRIERRLDLVDEIVM